MGWEDGTHSYATATGTAILRLVGAPLVGEGCELKIYWWKRWGDDYILIQFDTTNDMTADLTIQLVEGNNLSDDEEYYGD